MKWFKYPFILLLESSVWHVLTKNWKWAHPWWWYCMFPCHTSSCLWWWYLYLLFTKISTQNIWCATKAFLINPESYSTLKCLTRKKQSETLGFTNGLHKYHKFSRFYHWVAQISKIKSYSSDQVKTLLFA